VGRDHDRRRRHNVLRPQTRMPLGFPVGRLRPGRVGYWVILGLVAFALVAFKVVPQGICIALTGRCSVGPLQPLSTSPS